MRRTGSRTPGVALWLATVAVALHAFWPLLSQAAPKSAVLVPLCTVGGETHYVEVPGGKIPAEEHSASQLEHCALCLPGGADRAVLSSGFCAFEPLRSLPARFDRDIEVLDTRHVPVARARAPPFSRLADVATNRYGRNHEEAFALRHGGARAVGADPGRGVLRRGILLD
jgi:hypothetical protein